MDDQRTVRKRRGVSEGKLKVSAEEMARRREALRQADASNRIEGIFRDPESDVIFEAHMRGEIALSEIVPRLKAQLGIR